MTDLLLFRSPRRPMLRLATIAFILVAGSGNAFAQEFGIGADIASRYVWRGTDFGESASIQPALSVSISGFEIGTWASYAISPESAGANEHDIWVSYSVTLENGVTLAFGATDYYFPSPDGARFFNFDGKGDGAHWIEPFVSIEGPSAYPFSLTAAVFAYNDVDNSPYIELSYPFSFENASVAVTAGVVATESALYGTNKAAVANVGVSATKSIVVTDSFSIPVSVSYILNPYAERSYLVFGLSL